MEIWASGELVAQMAITSSLSSVEGGKQVITVAMLIGVVPLAAIMILQVELLSRHNILETLE